jgi:hypothetical protein
VVTEREIVEQAAETVVGVVKVHRKDIAHGRAIVELLFSQLNYAAAKRDEVQAEIVAETVGDAAAANRRAQMFRAVALPTHAATMRDLAQALRHVITLERQAFSLDDRPADEPEQADAVSTKIAGKILADLNAIAAG